MIPNELGELCLDAPRAGPQSFAEAFIDEGPRWGISAEGPAALDLQGQPDALPPIISIPLKLGALASAQLAAIGTLLIAPTSRGIGLASLGRPVIEGCSCVAWILDDRVTSDVRRRRAWLLWAVAEGNAASTAAADGGRTGAMSGSPRRLAEIEAAIDENLGLRLERTGRSKPKDWHLDGVAVPGPKALVVSAAARWFPGGDGGVLYSQVSREAHLDILTALALVDDRLVISTGQGLDFVPTVLAFWGLAWNHVLSYLGVVSTDFDSWLRRMLNAIGRSDLIDSQGQRAPKRRL